MRKTKRSRDGQKHSAILAAAMRLFLKGGYSKTSMDMVAKEAKVTKQTVYAHYQSKDMLFNEIMVKLCHKHVPCRVMVSEDETVEESLYKLSVSFLDMLTSREGLAATRLVVTESQHTPKLTRHYYESGSRQMLNMIADLLEQHNQRGNLKIGNTMSAASYFFAMLKGNYYLRTLLNIKPLPTARDKVRHIGEAIRIFMRAYGGHNPLDTRNVL